MLEINVTREMWAEWSQNPVTKLFFKSVKNQRESLKELIAYGKFDDKELTSAISRCQTLQDILNTEFEEEEND